MINLPQIEQLLALAQQLEIAAEDLPEETLEYDENTEDYVIRPPVVTSRELRAIDRVQDLAGRLSDMLHETKVATVMAIEP